MINRTVFPHRQFIVALVLDWAIIAITIWLAGNINNLLFYGLAIFIIGTRQHALGVLGHEGVHNLISKNRTINDGIANIFCAWPISFNVESFRALHIEHHKHLGTENDSELEYLTNFDVPTNKRNHPKQLGNASVMSWRVYSDPMWWFGVLVPMYIGKWHLDLKFISMATGVVEENMNFFLDVYKQLNELAEKGANIGFMDQLRADQLIGHYYTGKLFDKHFLENAKLEPRRTNVFTGIKATAFYTAAWYMKLQWKAFGLKGLLAPRSLYHIFRFLILSRKLAIADLIFRFQTRNLPYNSHVAKLRQEFKSYQYQPELPNWHEEVKAEVDKRVIEMVR